MIEKRGPYDKLSSSVPHKSWSERWWAFDRAVVEILTGVFKLVGVLIALLAGLVFVIWLIKTIWRAV